MKNLINDQRTMKAYDNDSNKKRSFQHFTPEERGQIQAFLEEGKSVAFIGRKLGKTRAAVSYEVKKGKTAKDIYRAKEGQKKADKRKEKFHIHAKWKNTKFLHFIERRLQKKQSPEVIAHFYDLKYPERTISVATIYNTINNHRLYLRAYLACPIKKKRYKSDAKVFRIPQRNDIRMRNKTQNMRNFGHWEGQSLNKKIVRKLIFETKQKGNFVLDKQHFRGFPSAFESIVRFTMGQISFKRQPCASYDQSQMIGGLFLYGLV